MNTVPATAERPSRTWLAWVAAGVIIGAVECVLAIAFAVFVFGGSGLVLRLPDGIGLYLGAAALTLAFLAWRSGSRGVVGSVQDAAAAVLSLVAAAVSAKAAQLAHVAQQSALKDYEAPDIFLTVIAATFLVTVLCGILFFLIGRFRLGGLIRFVPYPVVGGFLAGTGWLLFKGGLNAGTGMQLHLYNVDELFEFQLIHLVPALAFGVVLLVAVRLIRRPLVIPVTIAVGLAVFVAGMIVTGSSIGDVRDGGWLLGPFETTRLWRPVVLDALRGADWLSVLESWAGIATAVFVATLAILFNISGTELVLDRDLDTNRELRDAGILNVVSGALGGIPGYHALSLTALADRMKVDARRAGLIAALVPLAAVVFGASVIELIPRMIVGGVLVFIGLSFMVEWLWDKRRLLPPLEYAVVVAIVAAIVVWGFLAGVVLGLVLAVVLFAISYGRIELVREVPFGETYRSNVDRPAAERAELRRLAERVQILRVSGFVFFGSTNRLLERVRHRIEQGSELRFLVIDLRRVTGVDSSAVASFRKVLGLAEAAGAEVIFTGVSDVVRRQLARGGVVETEGVRFEPDLDRGLQRCEDTLLEDAGTSEVGGVDGVAGLPPRLSEYLERSTVEAGDTLLSQGDAPDDVFVLESGRLRVQLITPEGTEMRVATIRPGVLVGEIAVYTGSARIADVVADVPSVVLRLPRASIDRIEAEDPTLAIELHRWFASTIAGRLGDRMRALESLLD